MKKIFLFSSIVFSSIVFAQINTNYEVSQAAINNYTPFLDASSSKAWNASSNVGKGMVFPRVDLSKLETIAGPKRPGTTNAPTRYDGMVVYNTATGAPSIGADVTPNVTPGFYYYENKTDDLQGGHWVRIADAKDLESGVASGDFWSLNGNTDTTEAVIDPSNYAIKSGNFIGTKDNKKVTMGTNNVARLSIGDIPENVGGVDFNFVLKVYGKARFTQGIVTNNSTYPDYVFDNYFTGKSEENPSYKFKSLNEVESFIKENNHLPGVTSIKDLEKSEEGYYIDNTKLSIQTLEKVEELYLHMIEQQKEIKALKAEIAELKK